MLKNKNLYLSLVIPIYNEEKIVIDNLNKIVKYLKLIKHPWEIILVNDGSTDSTLELITKYKSNFNNIRLINFKTNKGKGAAVRVGMLGSKGEYILFMDVDLSVPLLYINKLLKALEDSSEVVIGSRRVINSKIVLHQPGIREYLGKVYTFLTQIILRLNLTDFTCGFKGFRSVAAKKVFSRAKINRWAYDGEILFLTNKFRFTIIELPVTWRNRIETRVRLFPDLPKSFIDTFMVRYFDLTGKYK